MTYEVSTELAVDARSRRGARKAGADVGSDGRPGVTAPS